MDSRRKIKEFCLSLPGAYEDYPFDFETPVMRHQGNHKIFALFIEHGGQMLLNLKCDPIKSMFWRDAFESVIPGYHMNKEHWNSVIMDGSVPKAIIREMISDSYELTKPKARKNQKTIKKTRRNENHRAN
ncbi:MAG: MmcQ/YjbR family DNA-binding protein [Syntrophomonadaceae bacterium]|jgi:predicted DNA-binding protein (MmcQ/YjbR family)|nr:MmcQ/YjbR family DNA-binding protein [Syntrophomonadaceae bacterium]